MATSFQSLPIIDLSPLRAPGPIDASSEAISKLAKELHNCFATSGFAYLANLPLSFTHDDVFGLTSQFFSLPDYEKMRMAKKTFVKYNENTYRGYFPTQPDRALDNLKEGFEIGSGKVKTKPSAGNKVESVFNLYEPNIWPSPSSDFTSSSRRRLTQLYTELQTLSSNLLSLLAISLSKSPDYFSSWLDDSLSTLRLLHYPPRPPTTSTLDLDDDTSSISSTTFSTTESETSAHSSIFDAPSTTTNLAQHYDQTPTIPSLEKQQQVKLSCTPHTDSGILTLLHQDPTGGLEVLNSSGDWIPAPYVPGTIVVNIGDLMAKVSGGRWVATMHRVRSPPAPSVAAAEAGGRGVKKGNAMGRFSVPFFFEPGEDCVVRVLDKEGREGEGVRYGEHVREKMKTWVEFQDLEEEENQEEV